MRKVLTVGTCTLSLCAATLFMQTSCIVKKDNGKHKGWTKNTNNPHHPATTNPGHTKGNSGNSGKSGKK